MEFSERVLVLQLGKFREADMWVRILSPTRGLISAFAFGGSRSRRRFVGCLDVFNEISVRISGSGRNPYLALQEGLLINGVTRLRKDWARFGLAVNCIRFLQSFGVAPEGSEKAYFLMRQTLQLLENEESLPRQLPFFFRARLAFDQGYALETSLCSHCGADISRSAACLLLQEGQIACSACADSRNRYCLPLGPEALSAWRAVHAEPPSLWGRITLSPFAGREFAGAVDGFIQYHVGISWKQGRFVRQ